MRALDIKVAMIAAWAIGVVAGCSGGAAPPTPAGPPPQSTEFSNIVSGVRDTTQSIPGEADAPYVYRFRQVEPGSDRFTYQDRDLSFYFRPTPDALYFQIENRQNRPVWIDWDRSVFYDAYGRTGKVAHNSTRYEDRFRAQPSTQIAGLQRYGDYVFLMDMLLDPSGGTQQLHRPLLPQDSTSPQLADRVFGIDMVLMIEDRPQLYTFRFKVVSVTPR